MGAGAGIPCGRLRPSIYTLTDPLFQHNCPCTCQSERARLAALLPCSIEVGAFTMDMPKGPPRRVFYAEMGGRREGMEQVGLIGVLQALVRELYTWGLQQPKLGAGYPPVQGDVVEGSGYMGGRHNQRDLCNCETYLPCGKQAVCLLADGRQIHNGKKTTLCAVWLPCSGAGGGQVDPGPCITCDMPRKHGSTAHGPSCLPSTEPADRDTDCRDRHGGDQCVFAAGARPLRNGGSHEGGRQQGCGTAS